MARRVVIDYAPRDAFKPFHNRTQRWACIVAHRRAGKTVACINDLIRRAIVEGRQDGRYAYIAPYHQQAKTVAWDYLLRFSDPVRKQANASELWVELLTGARIRLYGADNPDALRGIYLDGAILDEVADMRPRVWGEIIRPALADRKGWAVFIGTPKGHDAFYERHQEALSNPQWFDALLRASETGILDAEELESARKDMTADQFAQEFECSFEAAIQGAIYARELEQARAESRIGRVAHDASLPVHTVWDLGVGDATAIWFAQQHRNEVRIIDYYEATGEGLPHYAQILQARGYTYGKHYAPHDISVRELGSGLSRMDTAAKLGIRFERIPQQSLEDGIHAARLIFPRVWIDAEKCRPGIEALQHYRWDYNERMGEFRSRPVHDWSSHAADAFRYLATALKEPAIKAKTNVRAHLGATGWMA